MLNHFSTSHTYEIIIWEKHIVRALGGMLLHPVIEDAPGKKRLFLGNEAMVRGALESGVEVATTYPGTPASEIGDTFHIIAKDVGVYFEYSINEKVAVEISGGAAIAGAYAMTSMKHVGLNVASDAFITLGYTGVRGAFVVIVADDPSAHSSQNEQDSRYYSQLACVPLLEPATPSEAKEMVIESFEMSHRLEEPVMIRPTTRVCHTRAPITLGKLKRRMTTREFVKEPTRFTVVPAVARIRHKKLMEKLPMMVYESEKSKFQKIEKVNNGEEIGIITSGVSYTYVKEVCMKYEISASILKIGVTYPFPENLCRDFMDKYDQIIVVEELEPYIEKNAFFVKGKYGLNTKIFGKESGNFPRIYEFTPDIVGKGIFKALGRDYKRKSVEIAEEATRMAPSRPPTLCPGCPHRAVYYAIKVATKDKAIFPTDIGCYTLGLQPPLHTADLLLCMGSSIGTSSGISRVVDSPVITFIGDSTFFHAGIPGLVNAVHNKHNLVYTIMDNRTTAMTGHQPHPGVPIDGLGNEAPAISIENICRGCGAEFVRVVDPYDIKKTIEAFKDAIEYDGVGVVVTLHPCALIETAAKRKSGEIIPYYVDKDDCKKCGLCISKFACPAIYRDDVGRAVIDEVLCVGCGNCAQICPFGAIKRRNE